MKKLKIIIAFALITLGMSCENNEKISNGNSRKEVNRVIYRQKNLQHVVVEKTKKDNRKNKPESKKNVITSPDLLNEKEMDVKKIVFQSDYEEIEMIDDRNSYQTLEDNDYCLAQQNPLSTFSIDVDNASYSIVRQYLTNGQLPPKSAVRIEELINYFNYNYKQPTKEVPFSVYTEVAQAPWNENHQLVMIGINGKDLDYDNLQPSNLVFLIDTSGSMSAKNKLPLLKRAFKVLVENLPKNSKVAIVTYAGSAGMVLAPTKIKHKNKILNALNNLESGGSTAGGAGLKLAYQIAERQYQNKGNNRVIMATDGDFNVGLTTNEEMVNLIKEMKKKDIYLSILGFGMGNYQDDKMELISNAGNGNYFYIDNYSEAKKVFQKDLLANMFTVAKDVKIQVEFNPANVKAYRLIGYANRKLENKDFNDDSKDAGELGPGHKVTALYEIVPAGSSEKINNIDDLKYQKVVNTDNSNELLTVKLRYKPIKSNVSKLIKIPVENTQNKWETASDNYQFACSVAGFGMLLRESEYKGNASPLLIRKLALSAKNYDDKYKNEYITLIDKYEDIKEENDKVKTEK